jgi:CRISPR-associated protein Csm2
MPISSNNNYQGGGENRPRVQDTRQSVGNYHGNFQQQNRANAQTEFSALNYQAIWITNEANSALVTFAEKAGKFMARNGLTNSKIRSIYGEIKRIQMSEFEKEKSAFILLKPKVAYALGRDANNEGLKLFKLIFDRCSTDVTNQKSYQNFCNFMEAILAYHKANGGKD